MIKILLVEDDAGVGMVLSRLLLEVKRTFPGADIIWEKTLAGALTHICSKPYPAVILSDLLLLPDTPLLTTTLVMRVANQLSPVVFITGQDRDAVNRALGEDKGNIQVIEKGEDGWIRKAMQALASAMEKRAVETSDDKFKGLYDSIAALHEKGYGTPAQLPS